MITVEQLIKRLEQFPPDMEVRTCLHGYADVLHEIDHAGDVRPQLTGYSDRKVVCVIHPKYER